MSVFVSLSYHLHYHCWIVKFEIRKYYSYYLFYSFKLGFDIVIALQFHINLWNSLTISVKKSAEIQGSQGPCWKSRSFGVLLPSQQCSVFWSMNMDYFIYYLDLYIIFLGFNLFFLPILVREKQRSRKKDCIITGPLLILIKDLKYPNIQIPTQPHPSANQIFGYKKDLIPRN